MPEAPKIHQPEPTPTPKVDTGLGKSFEVGNPDGARESGPSTGHEVSGIESAIEGHRGSPA